MPPAAAAELLLEHLPAPECRALQARLGFRTPAENELGQKPGLMSIGQR
jgi:hypothetical protein